MAMKLVVEMTVEQMDELLEPQTQMNMQLVVYLGELYDLELLLVLLEDYRLEVYSFHVVSLVYLLPLVYDHPSSVYDQAVVALRQRGERLSQSA
jgi:hypothetical protein